MGTPVVESSKATFQRNPLNLWRLDLGSLLSTTTLSASIASVRATLSHERSAEVRFNKRLSVEIKLESPCQIFHFGTGVPKNIRGARFLEEIRYIHGCLLS